MRLLIGYVMLGCSPRLELIAGRGRRRLRAGPVLVVASSPHRTAALAALCAELDALAPRFPGIRLRVRHAVTP